jgi:Alcohol dehydrogenase GroES-like domain
MPTMEKGDVLGHEPMGEVVEVGSAVRKFKVGDRAVVPSTISCGECFFCQKGRSKCRSRTQGDGSFTRRAVRLFAYARRLRGGQAEYLRVPLPMWGRSKSRLFCRMTRCCFSRIHFRHDTYARLSAIRRIRNPASSIPIRHASTA